MTYDRKESSFSKWDLSENDWENFLENSSHFVVTGITPAFRNCQKSLLKGLKIAKKINCKTVFDLNFRRSRSQFSICSQKSFSDILPYVDILLGNIGSVNDVFDAQIKIQNDFDALTEATKKATDFVSELGNFETIGMTIRQQINANENVLGYYKTRRKDMD